MLRGKGTAAAKVQASYTDTLPRELQKQDPTADLTYAISALNDSGRSAGLSNLVKVPSAPTLPPPEHFSAQVESDGVLLAWDCPQAADVGPNPAISHRLRIYRRELSPSKKAKQNDTRAGEVNFASCAQNQPAQFLDQSFEWEKRYDYRATVAVWFRSVVFLHPEPSKMIGVPVIYQLHATAAWLVLLVWPFTRLVHAWSIPFQYLGRPFILYRRRWSPAKQR